MYNSLPVEIWRQIFAEAVRPCVHTQRFQTTGDNDDDHDPFKLHCPHLLHGILRTKMALCLVSKRFNSLATEFLYEYVHFTSNNFLYPATQHSPRGGTNKFWWTKVLVLRFGYATGGSAPLVTDLLSKCVNLRFLYFAQPSIGPEFSPDQVKLIYRSLPQSLQAICWRGDIQPKLENIPVIVLDNICQMTIESPTMTPTHVLTLPRLTYLRAKDSFKPNNLNFPVLTAVCLVAYDRSSELESSPLGLFIQGCAKQITVLQIENDRESLTVDFPLPLIDCCINLTTLKYDPFLVRVRRLPGFNDPDTIQHTKLTHVYNFISRPLMNVLYHLPNSRIVALHTLWAENYTRLSYGGFPALKHVTMLRSCVPDPIEEHVLSQIVSAWTDPRFKLECGVSACPL